MVLLIISILCMGGMSLGMRTATVRGSHPFGLSLCLRGTAFALMFGITTLFLGANVMWRHLPYVVLPAACAALFYSASGIAQIKAIQLGHLGASATILRCSMVIPTLASIFYWREIDTANPGLLLLRLTGISIVILSVIIFGSGKFSQRQGKSDSNSSSTKWLMWLAIAFICQGGWETVLRHSCIFTETPAKLLFICLVFAGAFLINIPVTRITRAVITRTELLFGAAIGAASIMASGLRLWILQHLDGYIVFPVTTVSVIILVQVGGVVFWKERIGCRGIIATALALAGILIITL